MTTRFAKKYIVAAVTTAAFWAAAIPVRAAGPSDDWFEQQRSVTEGVEVQPAAPPQRRTLDGARSRVGEPTASLHREAASVQQNWLIQQLRLSDRPPVQ